jgi:hypothetical protein
LKTLLGKVIAEELTYLSAQNTHALNKLFGVAADNSEMAASTSIDRAGFEAEVSTRVRTLQQKAAVCGARATKDQADGKTRSALRASSQYIGILEYCYSTAGAPAFLAWAWALSMGLGGMLLFLLEKELELGVAWTELRQEMLADSVVGNANHQGHGTLTLLRSSNVDFDRTAHLVSHCWRIELSEEVALKHARTVLRQMTDVHSAATALERLYDSNVPEPSRTRLARELITEFEHTITQVAELTTASDDAGRKGRVVGSEATNECYLSLGELVRAYTTDFQTLLTLSGPSCNDLVRVTMAHLSTCARSIMHC